MKKRAPTEHEIQAAIVDALRLAGFVVYETTAYRQKGASGVDKGIPDLLVAHDLVSHVFLGIEVKRDEKAAYSSREQREGAERFRFFTVYDTAHALVIALLWINGRDGWGRVKAGEKAKADLKVRGVLDAMHPGLLDDFRRKEPT